MKASRTFDFETFNPSFFTIECFQLPVSAQIKIHIRAIPVDRICKQSDSDFKSILFYKGILSTQCLLEMIETQFCDYIYFHNHGHFRINVYISCVLAKQLWLYLVSSKTFLSGSPYTLEITVSLTLQQYYKQHWSHYQ